VNPWLYPFVELVALRWPVLLLAAAPFLLTATVTTVFFVVQRAVQGRRPDELPESTEAWVRGVLARQGLEGVQVGPVPAGSPGMDAFWPSASYIALKPATRARRDPTFWAIGAHEVGHAIHARHPVWGPLFTSARGMSLALDRLLVAALVAGFLLGGATAIALVLGLLVAALTANAIVLADEAWASLTALRLLREDGRLGRVQLARALTSLIAALGAYVAGFAGRALTLALFPWVAASLAGDGLSGSGALPWPALAALAGLSLPLLTRAGRVAFRAVRPRRLARLSDLGPHLMAENASDLGGGVAALALVAASLTLLPTPGRDAALALALVPALVPITGVLGSIVLLPVMVLLHGVDLVDRRLTALATGFVPDDPRTLPRASGPPVLTLDMHNDHSLVRRSLDLLRIAYVPLLAVFWGEQIGRFLA
jgi:Zn-dependent membrane protease YugP